MTKTADSGNTFTLEYQADAESTTAAFNNLITKISDQSPEITGFRVELTTAQSLDDPVDLFESQDTTTREIPEGETTDETPTIPTLQSDALPSRVLSLMLDRDGDPIRSSDLQAEFDEEIDTARISQTLASLKRRELVAAKPDPEDKRANIYWPTEIGEQAVAALRN